MSFSPPLGTNRVNVDQLQSTLDDLIISYEDLNISTPLKVNVLFNHVLPSLRSFEFIYHIESMIFDILFGKRPLTLNDMASEILCITWGEGGIHPAPPLSLELGITRPPKLGKIIFYMYA